MNSGLKIKWGDFWLSLWEIRKVIERPISSLTSGMPCIWYYFGKFFIYPCVTDVFTILENYSSIHVLLMCFLFWMDYSSNLQILYVVVALCLSSKHMDNCWASVFLFRLFVELAKGIPWCVLDCSIFPFSKHPLFPYESELHDVSTLKLPSPS